MRHHPTINRLIAPALLLTLGALPGCGGVDSPDGETGYPDQPAIHSLLQQLTSNYVDPAGAPGKAIGLVVGVAMPGARFVTGFGATEIDGDTPPDANSIFDLASVGKVYTGYLLARALQNSEVQLDDALEDTFGPDVPTYQGRSIHLLDLATHTSGLPDYPGNLPDPGPVNPAAGYTLDMLKAFLMHYRLTVEPGTHYQYSNLGAGILGHILIRASGEKDFESLVQREIATHYGLVDTRVNLSPSQLQRKLQGYAEGEPAPALDIGEPLEGGGALRSSGDELLRFFEGAIAGDDPAWAQVMTPRRPSPNGQNASTGFLLNIEDPTGGAIYSKNGGAPGFSSQVMFTMDPPAAVVLLSNTKDTQGLYNLAKSILERVGNSVDFRGSLKPVCFTL